MPFPITCPACNARMNAPDEVEGKRIKCKKCGEAFVASRVDDAEFEDEAPAKSKPPRVPPKPSARDEDDETPRRKPSKASRDAGDEDRPRRRSEENDEEEAPRARKGAKEESAKPANLLLALLLGFMGILLSGGLTFGAHHFLKEKEPPPKEPAPIPKGGGPVQQGVGFPGAGAPKGGIPGKTK